MRPNPALSKVRTIGFVLIDDFSILPLASAIEVLDCANSILDRHEFSYSLLSVDGNPTRSHACFNLNCLTAPAINTRYDAFILCGNREAFTGDGRIAQWARAFSPNTVLGAVGSATYHLLNAGLLNGYCCAATPERRDGLSLQYPMVRFISDRAAIDRDRLTCASFLGMIDLILEVIRSAVDIETVWQIAKKLDLDQVSRVAVEVNRKRSPAQLLSDAITIMKANVENPISPSGISESVGLSVRGLQRLFQDVLNTSPSKYYLKVRLDHGRSQLIQTQSSVTEISYNCGFQSSAHFTRCYRMVFGRTPREDRRRANWSVR